MGKTDRWYSSGKTNKSKAIPTALGIGLTAGVALGPKVGDVG